METKEITVEQTGFHGRQPVPIGGSNWRAWNETDVAVDMGQEQLDAMFAAATCPARGCQCGGVYAGQFAPGANVTIRGEIIGATTTVLVPATWLPEELAKALGYEGGVNLDLCSPDLAERIRTATA